MNPTPIVGRDRFGPSDPLLLGDVAGLIDFAADATSTLELSDGRYCFDRRWDSRSLAGVSSRYTLMVAIGFERAARHGYMLPRSPDDVTDSALSRPEELSVGDRGLALWLLCRLGDARAEEYSAMLPGLLSSPLDDLEGMEVAWLVAGAAAALARELVGPAVAEQALRALQSRLSPHSPLLCHLGRGLRAGYPNFATQIYGVLALSMVARATGEEVALTQAKSLADHLVSLRNSDRSWPWLYDARSGEVVERYQIYSVHQDAMAPMAMFELSEATGDPGYARAGAEGITWCYGHNELNFQFYDPTLRFAHRSIRRAGWSDRGMLWANTAASLSRSSIRLDHGGTAVNATCRPYHLGWILEAWAGREHLGRSDFVCRP